MEVYNLVFITNSPTFYKINLFNKIAEHKKIYVVYLGMYKEAVINSNYLSLSRFKSTILNDNIESRSLFSSFIKLKSVLKQLRYDHIIYDGYEHVEIILSMFLTSQKKNAIIVESTIHESPTTGARAIVKKILLNRASTALVCGEAHALLVKKLGFKGDIRKTIGVGIFNKGEKISNNYHAFWKKSPRFLFVGRLVKEKNLPFLIDAFNEIGLPLTIVGAGYQKSILKSMSKSNITFLGNIENSKLNQVYQSHDIFILPSCSETWGVVVEEAIYYGLPVIVSDVVGCCKELVLEPKNGVVFRNSDKKSLKSAIESILKSYDVYKENVKQFSFDDRDEIQIKAYLL